MENYLVAFEYGSGTVWGCVLAESTEQIVVELPEVDVYDEPPAWMTSAELEALRADAVPVTVSDCIDHLLAVRGRRSLRTA